MLPCCHFSLIDNYVHCSYELTKNTEFLKCDKVNSGYRRDIPFMITREKHLNSFDFQSLPVVKQTPMVDYSPTLCLVQSDCVISVCDTSSLVLTKLAEPGFLGKFHSIMVRPLLEVVGLPRVPTTSLPLKLSPSVKKKETYYGSTEWERGESRGLEVQN